MTGSLWMRQAHRWVSIAFTAAVIAVFAAMGLWGEPPGWVYVLPLPPLGLLVLSGLYLFMLPYAVRWRARAGRSSGSRVGG